MLMVVGRLPWLGVCRELGQQASDKPRGRKPYQQAGHMTAPDRLASTSN